MIDIRLKKTAAAACVVSMISALLPYVSAAEEGSAGNPIVIAADETDIPGFSASSIRDATIGDEGAAYSGERYLSCEGAVNHPKWFEGNKLIKADSTYYLIKAEDAPEYYAAGSEAFSASTDIGNPESEAANKFEAVYANTPETRTVDGRLYTYRTLEKNGAMAINLECSPTEINYLTVQLWGGDTGDTILWVCDPVSGKMNSDNTQQPRRNGGVDRKDWVELNYVGETPQYDGGFIYATYEIPEIYTRNKPSVSLRLYVTGGPSNYSAPYIKEQTESSRGIYSVYMTQSPAFDPEEYGISAGRGDNSAPSLYSAGSAPDMEKQKSALSQAVQNGIDSLRSWQIYGNGAPSYMQGMITRTLWSRNPPETEIDWKNRYYTSSYMLRQNMTPLNMLEFASEVYKNADGIGLDDSVKSEMLERTVAGIDFLCRAQGSNGGFYSGSGWIGGPERKEASGNNLTGFGLRSAGKAVLNICGGMDPARLDAKIDSDADGTADTPRKEAWTNMLVSARDYLISLDGGYGHAPNQDMANSTAALRFEAAIEALGGSALSEERRAELFDICFGNEINPVTSCYWVSPKGTILENFGSLQGGYSGDYGTNAIVEMSELAELAERFGYDYSDKVRAAYRTIDNYYFIGKRKNGSGYSAQEYAEGIISNRNAYYPGTERYPIDIYGALGLSVDTGLKIIVNYLEQQDVAAQSASGGELHGANAHYEDNILNALRLYLSFDDILEQAQKRNIGSYDFVMEDENVLSYAWADEMARNVVIKDNGQRIYLALNWRAHVYSTTLYNTSDSRDKQSVVANNLCRVHASNDIYDSFGYAAMTTDGYSRWTAIADTGWYMQALMTVSYGDYTVIMNSYKDKSCAAADYETDAGLDNGKTYIDLISGSIYDRNAPLPPMTTLVLKETEPAPTDAPATPEPTDAPATPEPTDAPATPELTDAPATPEPTDAPATPEPTDAPATPEPTDAPATPELTDAPATPCGDATVSEPVITEANICIRVTNNTDEPINVSVFAASYDDNGALTALKMKTAAVGKGSEDIIIETNDFTKIFVWDENQRPLTNAILK